MKGIISFIFIFLLLPLAAQQHIPWDDPAGNNWPEGFKLAGIPSSLDSTVQNAIIYPAKGEEPQPLIISLHTWSGDYTQDDPVAAKAAEKNCNYIHPDFRGPAVRPEACGSRYVVADLEDAIDFCMENMNVDPANIHIIGVSGGGYNAMVAYMKVQRPIKSFSVWVGLSDLQSWYWESIGRNSKYADDLVKVTGGKVIPDFEDLKSRSPLYMDFSKNPHRTSKISIYAGVHDGYTGSVPVTQSINFYNKLVLSLGAKPAQTVSDEEIIKILAQRCHPGSASNAKLGDRAVHLFRKYGTVSLTLFEGGHEMLTDVAIQSIIDEK
jgi:hypothetical protein